MAIIAATVVAAAMSIGANDATESIEVNPGGATELSVSYGGVPAMRWIDAYRGGWNGLQPWGVVVVSLDHRFGSRIWGGLSYTISSASADHVTDKGSGSVTWHSLMLHGRYIYGWSGRWTFYGSLGLGILVSYLQPSWAPTHTSTHLAFQATPIGAQLHLLDNFDIFAEAGFGVQGLARAGVRVDF